MESVYFCLFDFSYFNNFSYFCIIILFDPIFYTDWSKLFTWEQNDDAIDFFYLLRIYFTSLWFKLFYFFILFFKIELFEWLRLDIELLFSY